MFSPFRTPQVVEKEGWVYIRVPLSESFMELVESCLGFQQWRGLQDVYVDGVVSTGNTGHVIYHIAAGTGKY